MHYTKLDKGRIQKIIPAAGFEPEPYRTCWNRDISRLIHSPAFRRLQGKTQLFPSQEFDFFRNRLTHSIEVGQIAKAIAYKLNADLKRLKKKYYIDPNICEFAGLAHDIGHPPFGHIGERTLNSLMYNQGGFEGNAQTLRILTKLEKKHIVPDTEQGICNDGNDKRIGLNLTYRSLASIIKYDVRIPIITKTKKITKGYYESESEIVKEIKKNVGGEYSGKFKTVECQIMEFADDIAYSCFDLEDSFKVGFIRPLDIISANDVIIKRISEKIKIKTEDIRENILNIFHDLFKNYFEIIDDPILTQKEKEQLYISSLKMSVDGSNNVACGYQRTDIISKFVGRFIRDIEFEFPINEDRPALSKIKINDNSFLKLSIIKNFIYEYLVSSPKVKIAEYRGDEIIRTIFETLSKDNGTELLPLDLQLIYKLLREEKDKIRIICDFIAGMTENHAVEFYGHINNVNPQTIFRTM